MVTLLWFKFMLTSVMGEVFVFVVDGDPDSVDISVVVGGDLVSKAMILDISSWAGNCNLVEVSVAVDGNLVSVDISVPVDENMVSVDVSVRLGGDIVSIEIFVLLVVTCLVSIFRLQEELYSSFVENKTVLQTK